MRADSDPSRVDRRRPILGILAVAAIFLGAVGRLWGWTGFGQGALSQPNVFADATLRVGLVLGALWLAWDSLRKPARWLPPGLAALGVLAIVAMAANPKMVRVLLPILGALGVLIGTLRLLFRR